MRRLSTTNYKFCCFCSNLWPSSAAFNYFLTTNDRMKLRSSFKAAVHHHHQSSSARSSMADEEIQHPRVLEKSTRWPIIKFNSLDSSAVPISPTSDQVDWMGFRRSAFHKLISYSLDRRFPLQKNPAHAIWAV